MIQIDERIDEARLRQFASQVENIPAYQLNFWKEHFLWDEGPEFYHGTVAAFAFSYEVCRNDQDKQAMGCALAIVSKHIVNKGWW